MSLLKKNVFMAVVYWSAASILIIAGRRLSLPLYFGNALSLTLHLFLLAAFFWINMGLFQQSQNWILRFLARFGLSLGLCVVVFVPLYAVWVTAFHILGIV